MRTADGESKDLVVAGGTPPDRRPTNQLAVTPPTSLRLPQRPLMEADVAGNVTELAVTMDDLSKLARRIHTVVANFALHQFAAMDTDLVPGEWHDLADDLGNLADDLLPTASALRDRLIEGVELCRRLEMMAGNGVDARVVPGEVDSSDNG